MSGAVNAEGATLKAGTISRQEGERRLPFEGARNFRDLGGYPAADGRRTRWGLVYRSGSLHNLTEGDLAAFGRLGVRGVFDLRGGTERDLQPNPVPSVHLPVLDELAGEEGLDIVRAKSLEEAVAAVEKIYIGMLSRRAAVYGQLLKSLADQANLPAVFHCTAGKDRTGIAAALVLGALGVDRATVLYDYELTGEVGATDAAALRVALEAAGMAPEAADVVLGAPATPMEHALEELDRRYGGTEAYLLGPAGMGARDIERLREALTEGPTGEGIDG